MSQRLRLESRQRRKNNRRDEEGGGIVNQRGGENKTSQVRWEQTAGWGRAIWPVHEGPRLWRRDSSAGVSVCVTRGLYFREGLSPVPCRSERR